MLYGKRMPSFLSAIIACLILFMPSSCVIGHEVESPVADFLKQEQEPAEHGQVFGKVQQDPARLTKQEATRYTEDRQMLSRLQKANKYADELRKAFMTTDPVVPKVTRADHAPGSPIVFGADLTGQEVLTIARALGDEPVLTQFIWIRLYGSNLRLREEIRDLRARLGLETNWPSPTDTWPSEVGGTSADEGDSDKDDQ